MCFHPDYWCHFVCYTQYSSIAAVGTTTRTTMALIFSFLMALIHNLVSVVIMVVVIMMAVVVEMTVWRLVPNESTMRYVYTLVRVCVAVCVCGCACPPRTHTSCYLCNLSLSPPLLFSPFSFSSIFITSSPPQGCKDSVVDFLEAYQLVLGAIGITFAVIQVMMTPHYN